MIQQIEKLKKIINQNSMGHLPLSYRVDLMKQIGNPQTVQKVLCECCKKACSCFPEEFGAEGFRFNPPSEGTTLVEKCRTIASEMDGIFKQFRMYVQDGEIDRELFEMSSEHIIFSQLPSFIKNKYAYVNNQQIQNEQFLLFSDQSSLQYTEKDRGKYKSFCELLLNEKMKLSDFADFQKKDIKWLIERGAIIIQENNFLTGSIAVVDMNDSIDMISIGYCISKKYWHKGITSEALSILIKFFFEEVKVNRIEAKHNINNPNSGKVMLKCGLKKEGVLRSIYKDNTGLADAAIYSILKNEYFN